jgi:hypothetical protein
MGMGRIPTILFLIWVLARSANAQTESITKLRETGKTLLDKNIPDSVKLRNADQFVKDFEIELLSQGPDWVTTESLPFVSRLSSKDKQTEIFTWALKRSEDSFRSYGLVWRKEKKEEAKIFRLDDKSETLKNTETKNLTKTTWLGCVYYSITEISKGNKPMFLLLGYGGNTPQVRRKVAEILTFNNVDDIQFGAPIFEKDKKKFNRVVLEFNAKATVAMKFDVESQTLFYDFLVPVSDIYLNNPAFYGPNGSYDAFELKGGKLLFIKDADARNPTDELGNRSKKVERKLPPR